MAVRKNPLRDLFTSSKSIRQNLDLLNSTIDDIYSDTYMSTSQDKIDSEKIRSQIDDSISSISRDNGDTVGNLTKLYTRATQKMNAGNSELIKSMNLFEDPLLMDNIVSTWMQNKWIKDLELEIDTVLKYMPKLKEALECKKDCVLSADHFAKDFVNFHSLMSANREEMFGDRMEAIKKTYKLPENIEKWYDETQTYGESFIYIVPYNKAFKKLLDDKKNTVWQSTYSESIIEGGVLQESVLNVDTGTTKGKQLLEWANTLTKESNINNLKITFNHSLLESAAKSIDNLERIKTAKKNMVMSMKEQFESYVLSESELSVNKPVKPPKNKISNGRHLDDKVIPDDLELPKDMDDASSEMLINPSERSSERTKIDIPGCIVKTLKRENIIPIYIEDICLGYYYFEFKNGFSFEDPNNFEYSASINTLGSRGSLTKGTDVMKQSERDNAINFIAAQLSDMIDAQFINANQDIKKELYMILKHNQVFNGVGNTTSEISDINVTFLPAEDVTHIYFNQDPITKRGITDLKYALFPAKLYSCLYITETLGRLTRGQDKRVYYVKQNVETNVSRTLLNVINQIKRGNFGARQMENLSNILNVTGRFNDIIMPLSQSGDAPVQIDVLQGQQFSDNSELLSTLERISINATDVPYDLIEARQSLDYAIQATMSNSKLMRNVYKRQDAYQIFCSEIVSKIYNYEYNENEQVEIEFPAPSFLNMTNGSQLVNGTAEYAESLANNELADEPDEVKAEFKKIVMRYYIPTHVNSSNVDKWKKRAKMNVQVKLRNNEEQ